jgi:hypothetical protein
LIATSIVLPAIDSPMHQWLQTFAYKTGFKWSIFFLAALIIVGKPCQQ